MRHEVTRKRSTKTLKHAGNLFRKNKHKKCLFVNSRLTDHLSKESILSAENFREFSSCARKGTADIDILMIFKNVDRKIM